MTKETELKLIAELMKNSRRSDREIAKTLGVSQPTVTRLINKLEKEGYIKEYTAIPDFCKLGFRILALIFVKLKKTLSPAEADEARRIVSEELGKSGFGIVMLERGIGLGFDGVIMAYYPDYANYVRHRNIIKSYPFVDISKIDALLINLSDRVRYRPLTFSYLASVVLALAKEKEH